MNGKLPLYYRISANLFWFCDLVAVNCIFYTEFTYSINWSPVPLECNIIYIYIMWSWCIYIHFIMLYTSCFFNVSVDWCLYLYVYGIYWYQKYNYVISSTNYRELKRSWQRNVISKEVIGIIHYRVLHFICVLSDRNVTFCQHSKTAFVYVQIGTTTV